MGKEGSAEVIDIFGNNLLNIKIPTNDFFVIICLFELPKACSSGHIVWSRHKRSQQKANLSTLKFFTIAGLLSLMSTQEISV